MNMIWRLEDTSVATYVLARDDDAQGAPTTITCLICGMTSHHPDDVATLYCGRCHRFHDVPVETVSRA